MNCPHCASAATTRRQARTTLGYRRFNCRSCKRRFNERTGTPFNHLQVPTDVVLLAVLWRLRYKLSFRDVAEMLLQRGVEVTHETAASNLRAHSESEVGAPVVTGGPHAAAISESSERQRAAKSRRCSARGIESPRPRRQRKYCRNSSNAEQKRAADAKLPKPRIG